MDAKLQDTPKACVDPDDAPELDEAFFRNATPLIDDKPVPPRAVRRGGAPWPSLIEALTRRMRMHRAINFGFAINKIAVCESAACATSLFCLKNQPTPPWPRQPIQLASMTNLTQWRIPRQAEA